MHFETVRCALNLVPWIPVRSTSWFSLTAYGCITSHMQPALHAVSMNLGIPLSLLRCCWLNASGLLPPRPHQHKMFLLEGTLSFLIATIHFKLIPSHPPSFKSDFVQEYVFDVSTGPYRPKQHPFGLVNCCHWASLLHSSRTEIVIENG